MGITYPSPCLVLSLLPGLPSLSRLSLLTTSATPQRPAIPVRRCANRISPDVRYFRSNEPGRPLPGRPRGRRKFLHTRWGNFRQKGRDCVISRGKRETLARQCGFVVCRCTLSSARRCNFLDRVNLDVIFFKWRGSRATLACRRTRRPVLREKDGNSWWHVG